MELQKLLKKIKKGMNPAHWWNGIIFTCGLTRKLFYEARNPGSKKNIFTIKYGCEQLRKCIDLFQIGVVYEI